jgi:hypothetical protein
VTRLVQFLVIHQGNRAQRPPPGSVGDRQDHLQVAAEFGAGGSRRLLTASLALRFQKKLRGFEDTSPHAG